HINRRLCRFNHGDDLALGDGGTIHNVPLDDANGIIVHSFTWRRDKRYVAHRWQFTITESREWRRQFDQQKVKRSLPDGEPQEWERLCSLQLDMIRNQGAGRRLK